MGKEVIILLVVVMLSILVIASEDFNKYYKIDLNYNYGKFSLNNLNIEISDIHIQNYFGFYLAKVIDFKNETLNWTYFNIPREIFYDEVDENGTIVSGGLLKLDEVNFTIYAPYYENAKEIVIYDGNLTEKLIIFRIWVTF